MAHTTAQPLAHYGMKQCHHCMALQPEEAVLCGRCMTYVGVMSIGPEGVTPPLPLEHDPSRGPNDAIPWNVPPTPEPRKLTYAEQVESIAPQWEQQGIWSVGYVHFRGHLFQLHVRKAYWRVDRVVKTRHGQVSSFVDQGYHKVPHHGKRHALMALKEHLVYSPHRYQ